MLISSDRHALHVQAACSAAEEAHVPVAYVHVTLVICK